MLSGIDRIEAVTCMDEVVEPSDDLPHRFRAKLLAHRGHQAEATGAAAWWSKVRTWSRPRQLVAAGVFVAFVAMGIYLGTFRSGEPEPTAVIQEISIAEDLPMLEEMGILRNLDLLEDFDAIQSLSEGGPASPPSGKRPPEKP